MYLGMGRQELSLLLIKTRNGWHNKISRGLNNIMTKTTNLNILQCSYTILFEESVKKYQWNS